MLTFFVPSDMPSIMLLPRLPAVFFALSRIQFNALSIDDLTADLMSTFLTLFFAPFIINLLFSVKFILPVVPIQDATSLSFFVMIVLMSPVLSVALVFIAFIFSPNLSAVDLDLLPTTFLISSPIDDIVLNIVLVSAATPSLVRPSFLQTVDLIPSHVLPAPSFRSSHLSLMPFLISPHVLLAFVFSPSQVLPIV